MEQRSDSLDGFGRGIYVHTFEFAGFDPAAGLRRFLGFRRLLFLLSSLFVDLLGDRVFRANTLR